ncbi:MAG: amidase, partial [Deltaproteobacteria bacterium]|nr:amidase [Deltaproteobacteria bacterium]
TYAGMPAISIPCGFDKAGLPHGLQIVGKFGEDELLVQFAQELSDMITG